MGRFQLLVKKKITKRLSEEEAEELRELLAEREDCRVIFQTIFGRLAGGPAADKRAEEAFALHARNLHEAN